MAGIVVCGGGVVGIVSGTALYLGLHFGDVPETTQVIVEGVVLGVALLIVVCCNLPDYFKNGWRCNLHSCHVDHKLNSLICRH